MFRIAPAFLALAFGALLACSDSTDPTEPPLVSASVQGVPGSYAFEFLDPITRAPVTSEPFGSAVLLVGHVSGPGGAVTQGSIAFQYCSLKGVPPNDINRIDESPTQVCLDGDGTWDNLATRKVDGAGSAEYTFCCPQVTPLIGFRIKYTAKNSGVQGGTSLAQDFTWF